MKQWSEPDYSFAFPTTSAFSFVENIFRLTMVEYNGHWITHCFGAKELCSLSQTDHRELMQCDFRRDKNTYIKRLKIHRVPNGMFGFCGVSCYQPFTDLSALPFVNNNAQMIIKRKYRLNTCRRLIQTPCHTVPRRLTELQETWSDRLINSSSQMEQK